MFNLSEINWGPTDASEYDANFVNKFIETEEIKKLVGPKYWIISGEKGSGKTALCLGITLKYGDKFDYIKQIRFDEIEFCAVVKNLKELSSITDVSSLTLMSNYWEYVLIIELMREVVDSFDLSHEMSLSGTKIHNYLRKKKLIDTTTLSAILSLIATAWTFVKSWTDPNGGKQTEFILPSNFDSQLVDTISKYPIFDPEFIEIRNIFCSILQGENEKILITLDGFDRLKPSEQCNNQSLGLIFEGLVEAVYSLSISKDFSNVLQIKCFIPYDRYIALDIRDADKVDSKYRNIHWCYNSLQEFLAKRMNLHSRLSHLKQFNDMWNELMPVEIENKYYGIKENSYDYILRHTMYRPRHIQIHLEELAGRYESMNIDPTMIPKSIRESSKKIAGFIVKEYKIDHPNFELFLRQFKGICNVITYREFRLIVEKVLNFFNVTSWTIDKKIDSLYNIGFFGIVRMIDSSYDQIDRIYRYRPPRKNNIAPYQCDFYYVKPIQEISSSLDEDSKVAIHPVFFDYCDLSPHPDMIIG